MYKYSKKRVHKTSTTSIKMQSQQEITQKTTLPPLKKILTNRQT